MRKTTRLVNGYQLHLEVPVLDYDSNMTVNGNAGINVAGQVCLPFASVFEVHFS